MTLTSTTFKSHEGHIVLVKTKRGLEVIDKLMEFDPRGILLFESGHNMYADDIISIEGVGPLKVAQRLVDKNAAEGKDHAEYNLYPDAGTLSRFFPHTFKSTTEAVKFLLDLTPKRKS